MQPVPACARRSGCGRSSWVRALNPPPPGIQWLVTAVVWLGSAGVIVCLAIFGLLVPRLAAVRRIALAAVLTWAVCVLLGEILGPAPGAPCAWLWDPRSACPRRRGR